jgi:ABC-type sugar transport system substrate-binding protein
MEEDGVAPEAAAAALERARQANVPLGLVDVGGQPLQRLTRAVRTLPGERAARSLTTHCQRGQRASRIA